MAKWKRQDPDLIRKLGDCFREHGFEGASLSQITRHTGLGKGSLYNAFPGGKDEMAEAVLDNVDQWFDENVFTPLQETDSPRQAVRDMLAACEDYFRGGGRICLMGAFALTDVRDQFQQQLDSYFRRWLAALADCLGNSGLSDDQARDLAEEILSRIQGALVLGRAFNDMECFRREIRRLKDRIPA